MDVNSEIYELVRDCTVRINLPSSTAHGTGCFVAPKIVVTCAHVIEKHLGEISITWKGNPYVATPLEVTAISYPDLALLRIDIEDNPYVYMSVDIEIGDDLYSYGCTDECPDGESITTKYEGPSSVSSEQHFLKLKKGQIRPGASGAPILNARTGTVCGIIKRTRNRSSDLGGRGIPVSSVLDLLSGLNGLSEIIFKPNHLWASCLSSKQSEDSSLTDLGDRHIADLEKISPDSLREKLDHEKRLIYSKFTSGSNRIRVGDLIGTDLLQPFRIYCANSEVECGCELGVVRALNDQQQSINTNFSDDRYIIIADPGIGKSTITYKIFDELLAQFYKGSYSKIPIRIDLRDFLGVDDCGDEGWFLNLLENVGINVGSFLPDNGSVGHRIRESVCIILDSLDEYLTGLTTSEITRELNRFVFKNAIFVTCRTQYFERYLMMSPFSNLFNKVRLLPWTKSEASNYTEHYVRKHFSDKSLADREKVQKYITKYNRDLTELCQVPLRLNMTLELLLDSKMDYGVIEDLLSLYHAYVHNWLIREANKSGNILDIDDKLLLLEKVAWHFYEKREDGGGRQAARFSSTELGKYIEKSKIFSDKYKSFDILSDLVSRSILVEEIALFSGAEPRIIKYTHKSFQEYFVARYIYNLFLDDVASLAQSFQNVISQEIGQFLKEYFKRINSSDRLLNSVVENCIEAFFQNVDDGEISSITFSKRRIARQQLAYYMGHLKSDQIYTFLSSYLEKETDLWTKRSIAIGLAFGGHDDYLTDYIDKLSKARSASNGEDMENEVNIGFHLSYFGDQPYSEYSPEHDQGLPVCSNTIEKLLRQLDSERNKGSWRLDLYTLLDIEKHRLVSKEDCRRTLMKNIDLFEKIVTKMYEIEVYKDWRELKEAYQLLNDLKRV